MRKLFTGSIIAIDLLLIAAPAFAVKPESAAQFIDWNLSGDVMPVPPWGLADIPGSDTASKLICSICPYLVSVPSARFNKRSFNMFLSPAPLHIPDGFLNLIVSLVFWAATIILVGLAISKTNKTLGIDYCKNCAE